MLFYYFLIENDDYNDVSSLCSGEIEDYLEDEENPQPLLSPRYAKHYIMQNDKKNEKEKLLGIINLFVKYDEISDKDKDLLKRIHSTIVDCKIYESENFEKKGEYYNKIVLVFKRNQCLSWSYYRKLMGIDKKELESGLYCWSYRNDPAKLQEWKEWRKKLS